MEFLALPRFGLRRGRSRKGEGGGWGVKGWEGGLGNGKHDKGGNAPF